MVQRLVPAGLLVADHRVQQPAFQPDGLAQMRALGAQLAEIGGMVRVARDLTVRAPVTVALMPQPTPQ